MIVANDGGASVSHDAGKSWTTEANQPTAQFYHVATDNGVPYKLYGAQQDNSTVAIASRSDSFAIDRPDWYDVGGCFFFQAEDGIRDTSVTGVQTCALPI